MSTAVVPTSASPLIRPSPVVGGEAPVLSEVTAAPVASTPFSNASLYVGDLQPDVVESNLFELFSSVGSVASIRICRDTITRRSLGYGYVNFHNPEDAARAIDILNYEKIKGRHCRIMWSQRDPTLRKTGVGNVFIKNLDAAIDMQTLNDTFSKFGNILSCKVSTDKDGVSKGYGFVHFDSDEAANNAITHANNTLLLSKVITVENYIRRTDRRVASDWTNLYVKNFPLDWTEEKLRELFGTYGNITSFVLATSESGESVGFGYVNFDTHESAEAAVNGLHSMKVGVEMVSVPVEGADGLPTGETTQVSRDKLLFVQKHQKKSERESIKIEQAKAEQAKKIEKYAGRNLYVRNFEDTIDEQRLMTEFKEFGTISSCVIMRSNNGVSKGYGFVCYSSPEEATKAVTQLNGKMLERKPLYVALAQRKDQRRMQLEQQRRQAQLRSGMMMGGPMPYGGLPMGNFGPRGMMPQQYMNQQFVGVPGGRPNYNNQFGPRGGVGARGGPRGGANNRGGRGRNFGGPTPYSAGPVVARSAGTPPAPAMVAPVSDIRTVPLTPQALANATEEQRTNMIGERLFPLVASKYPEHASKITGMLLEMEITDLLHLLDSPASLGEKMNEALQVLLNHQAAERS